MSTLIVHILLYLHGCLNILLPFRMVDEREIEQGYANFHRTLNRILRARDIRLLKKHIATHPREAGKLSHLLGLSDEMAEIEMHKTIITRSALKDIWNESRRWLKEHGIEPPVHKIKKRRRKRSGWKRR